MAHTKICTALVASLAVAAGTLAPSAPATADDYVPSIFRNVALARIAADLDRTADALGTPIVAADPTSGSKTSLLHASAQLESAARLSFDDLSRGADLSFSYLASAETGLAAEYYIARLEIDDPVRPETGTWSVVDENGRIAAEGAGAFAVEGSMPAPGEPLEIDCDTTYNPTIDENGEACIHTLTLCTGWDTSFGFEACLKTLD